MQTEIKMKNYLYVLLFAVLAISACKKQEYIDYQALAFEQLAKDTVIIKEFIAENDIPAIKHPSGVYYQIIEPGSGDVVYKVDTRVEAKYTGRLLNGTVFDTSVEKAATFTLGGVIAGWQIGIPLIQKGGKIRLLIPSGYAYGTEGQSKILPNTILDFDIELINVQ